MLHVNGIMLGCCHDNGFLLICFPANLIVFELKPCGYGLHSFGALPLFACQFPSVDLFLALQPTLRVITNHGDGVGWSNRPGEDEVCTRLKPDPWASFHLCVSCLFLTMEGLGQTHSANPHTKTVSHRGNVAKHPPPRPWDRC